MRYLGLGVAMVLSIIGNSASGQDLLRALEPGKQPADARLAKPRDYNTTTEFKADFAGREQWEARAVEVRQQILVSNGLSPLPARTPLNAVIHGKIERDEYTVEKVYFASWPGHYVTGNLYRPKSIPAGMKAPGVLCPHGHWANGRFFEAKDAEVKKALATGAEKTPEGAKYPLQARCAMLARMGCIVFHYDMVGYADSKPLEHRKGFLDVDAELHLQSFMGLQTWNSIRALDFITSLPEVDPQRIAVTGASGGGTQTMILGAIDPRPAVIFPAVMVSQNMQGGCICENASLLRVGLNNIEFAACFAPKPQGMTGADDWTKDIETKGLPQLKKIYGFYGAPDNVGAWYRSFPHNYNQVSRERMYNWLNQHLKLGRPDPVVEKPFVPVPPRELSVWDDQHPLPRDAAEPAVLRKTWGEVSDAALAKLAAGDPQEYRRLIADALRVMINDKWPVQGAAEVLQGSQKEKKLEGCLVETGLLTRPGEGSSMPYALLVPQQWNGQTVLWVHPGGKLTLVEDQGKPGPAVQRLLDAKFAVLAGDLFATGEYLTKGKTAADLLPVNKDFAGYTFGYNRSLLAQRVHDLLTLVNFAKSRNAKSIHQVAWEGAGVWGLLAKALAQDAIARSAIDLAGFDFDQVKSAADENMLPGALKYGGLMAFASLCRTGQTALWRSPEGKSMPQPARGVSDGRGEMVEWLVGK